MHVHKIIKNNSKISLLHDTDLNSSLAIAIGNFDGMHIGHQNLLNILKNKASQLDLTSAILSFYPHPQKILKSQHTNFIQIDSLEVKILKALQYVDMLIIAKFCLKLSKLSAIDFVRELAKLNIKYIYIGKDFLFGYKKSYTSYDLKQNAQRFDIIVEIIDLITISHLETLPAIDKISSSNIRAYLQRADFIKAKQLLGADFYYMQRVIKGKKIGRTLGFPTINLKVDENFILSTGIYIVLVEFKFKDIIYNLQGVASLGYRPTIKNIENIEKLESKLILEVYLLNWHKEIYGIKVKVTFLHKIREEQYFSSIEYLKSAIKKDIEYTHTFFKEIKELN